MSSSEREQWKAGNEFLPYHPSASHVDPRYRDGWNHCYETARRAQASAEPVAWMHEDDCARVISAIQKAGALKDGGASATSLRPYSVRLYAAPQRAPLTREQRAVLDFLYGVGDLQGVGFGDKPAGERGNYWWRKQLREAFGITAGKAAIAAGTNGEAP